MPVEVVHRRSRAGGRVAVAAWLASALLLVAAPDDVAAQTQSRPSTDEATLIHRAAASRALGREDAPVLVYEITDFQCPYCARFADTVFPLIDSAFVATGKVQWVFVNLPLPSHTRSWSAAKAAMCAGGVADMFWPLRERLFRDQNEWSAAPDPFQVFARYAGELGVPAEPFRECMMMDRVVSILLEDVLFAATARVSGTPTFIIHPDQNIVGFKTFEQWQMLLESALERQQGKR